MIRDLVRDARTNIGQLYISDVLAAQSPVAAFLKGVSLLSQNKLELASNSFRSAMRASADFYPAMVYLGACYAAGGNDKEASGAWRTALIKEGDVLPLHTLLADSLLRQDKGEMALETLDKARARWPNDDGIQRRFVLAAMLAGEYADGLQTLDGLVARKAEDEPTLTAGLIALYEAFRTGEADRDGGEGPRAHDAPRRRLPRTRRTVNRADRYLAGGDRRSRGRGSAVRGSAGSVEDARAIGVEVATNQLKRRPSTPLAQTAPPEPEPANREPANYGFSNTCPSLSNRSRRRA